MLSIKKTTSSVIVSSITGMQSHAIAEALAKEGHTVYGLTRSNNNIVKTNINNILNVDYSSVNSLTNAFQEADTVVFTPPIGANGFEVCQNMLNAAEQVDISTFILNLGGRIYHGHPSPITESKERLARAVLAFHGKAFVVEPTTYMENLIAPWSLARLVNDKVFEYPDGAIPWISHKTLGESVLALIEMSDAINSGHIRIQGPVAISGQEVAHALSTGMNKEIQYKPVSYSEFGRTLDIIFGEPTGTTIANYYYKWLEENPSYYLSSPHDMGLLRVDAESIQQWSMRQPWDTIRANVK